MSRRHSVGRRGVWSVSASGMIGVVGLAASGVRGDETPPLPAEVRQVQQALGGPAVDSFPQLRPLPGRPMPPDAGGSWITASDAPQPGLYNGPAPTPADPRAPHRVEPDPYRPRRDVDPRSRGQATTMREAASRLDQTANQLESLDLYEEADGVRALAQRLRLRARALLGTPTPAQAHETPRPTLAPLEQ